MRPARAAAPVSRTTRPGQGDAAEVLEQVRRRLAVGPEPRATPRPGRQRPAGDLTARPMHRIDAIRMIKQRAKAIGLTETIGCHTFLATGITAYLENGGTIKHAQQIAAHESPKTTKLYDRISDQFTLDEVERIVI